MSAHRASVYIILGQIYLWSGRDAEAYKALMKARADAGPLWSSPHPEAGIVDGALGMLAYRGRRYEEAKVYTRRALESMEKLLGPDHREVGLITGQLALVLKKRKRQEESQAMEARARGILDRAPVDPRVSAWSWRGPK